MDRVLLHGFGGSGASWDAVRAHLDAAPLTPDLRGHGARADDRPVTFGTCVADVLDEAPGRFTLAGYSLGGRIALHVALAAPDRVERLVIVSATAGIEDGAARARRRTEDEALASGLVAHGMEVFAESWGRMELWAGDPPHVLATQREELLAADPDGLAAALTGIGAGAMEPLWDRLGELPMPATIVAGERDVRYVAIAERLVRELPDAELVVVPGAGHGLLRERPREIAALL